MSKRTIFEQLTDAIKIETFNFLVPIDKSLPFSNEDCMKYVNARELVIYKGQAFVAYINAVKEEFPEAFSQEDVKKLEKVLMESKERKEFKESKEAMEGLSSELYDRYIH